MTTTTKTRFQISLAFVLQAEGGYTDDPGDNGGATNFGITHIDYDAYRKSKGEPTQDVRLITQTEVEDIYSTRYWSPCHCEGLPVPLDIVTFDCSVNEGIGRAILTLNQIFNTSATSEEWSQALSDAIHNTQHPANLALADINARVQFYEYLATHYPHDEQFLRGWINRLDALKTATDIQG